MNVTETIRLPNYLLDHVRQLAEREGITVDQFIASAVAEKASVWDSVDYLNERAKRGNREKFRAVMDKIPDVEPDDRDKLE
jgi:hypothetical protein